MPNEQNNNSGQPRQLETAVFGGGCFWCLEPSFSQVRGVENVTVGYAGGEMTNPTYEQVSSGRTGHAEVVKIEFDPLVVSYQKLLEIFFTIHDPTTLNRQGNDIGEQYRSIILYTSEEQKKTAESFIQKLAESNEYENPVVTQVVLLDKFYTAEEYHQKYYYANPQSPYCQLVIAPKIKKFQEKFGALLK